MARLITSLGHAFRGLGYVIINEPNARIHLLFAIGVLVVSAILRIGGLDFVALFAAIVMVFLAEIINTALEKTLDIVEPNHHPQVKVIKDMAAGGVLVTAIAAVIIGVVIITPYLGLVWLG